MAEYTDFETFTEYGIFDGDQHIFEPWDCLADYIPAEFAERTIRRITNENGETMAVADGQVLTTDNQPDMMGRPGSLKDMLKSMKGGSLEDGGYQFITMDPAFQRREDRLIMLDKQNIDTSVVYPGSVGLLQEFAFDDNELYYATSWAYLRYIFETWGFNTDNRILFAPVVSFRDPKRSGEQLDWLIERGCKVVTFCPGPAYGRSPGDTYFDPIWSRLNDAGVVAAYHINEGMRGYKAERSRAWGEEENPTFYTQSAWQWAWAYGEQPALETFSSLIYSNLFARYPKVKVLSAEHGSEWIPTFVRKMDKMRGMGRNGRWLNGQLAQRPSEIFQQHFRVVPFWEDDIEPVIAQVGADVIVGGSDFPHSEGLAFPTQLVEHVSGLDAATQRKIMRENGMELVGLDPT
jgi:predicted TIM-barrel fold metal-dependent hydrolase